MAIRFEVKIFHTDFTLFFEEEEEGIEDKEAEDSVSSHYDNDEVCVATVLHIARVSRLQIRGEQQSRSARRGERGVEIQESVGVDDSVGWNT